MKKFLPNLFLISFFVLSFNSSYSQTWVEMMKDPDANFYETVQEFEDYWSTHTVEKGKGYKQFRRWQDLMAPRVFPKGDVKQANRARDEFKIYLDLHPELVDPNRSVIWSALGPFGAPGGGGAGRVNALRIHPTTTTTIYACTPAGGLWVSTNSGTSWTTATDQLTVIGCTDIAIDPITPTTMYLATGDGDAGDTYSVGVLKSTDGGTTWVTTGLTWTVTQGRTISKLKINPTNPLIVIAATSNGIYRTTDGGANWAQVQTGNFKDLEFRPTDPTTVYACGTTFWKSTNSGASFTQITSGVPATSIGRLALAVTDANSAYVYMLAGNNTNSGFTGVYRSTDNGTTFTTRSTTPNLLGWSNTGGDTGGQAWYDLSIAASPTNADVVVIGGVNIWRSTNGGTNWTINGHWTGSGAPYVHADIHDLIFLPGNGTTYYSGNDGGVFRTTNSGTAWTDISGNMNIGQSYEIGLSASSATILTSGHQDNGTNKMNGATWTEIYGGDGMQTLIDRTNNNVIYASYVNGDFQRSTNGGGAWTNIVTGLTGTAAWEAPIHQDPVTANTLYAGYQNMFKTTNQGTNWAAIGTLPGTGTVVEFDVAPSNNQIIYAVKSNGIYKTINGGTAWTTVTGTVPVASAAITYVEISPTDPNKVWVTLSGYSSGNKVFMTTNGGTSWTNYSTGLPNLPVNCIVYQTGSSDAVYVGTDVGVYYRDNTLTTWQAYFTALPNVIVRDLEIYAPTGKIRAGTFGRGVWEADLYSPGTLPPVADFVANNTNVCPGSTVIFTDLSTYSPTGWSWSFTGGTPTTSTVQNPSIVYNTPGTYAVTLTATNANGNDSETKTAYITVSSPVALPLIEGFQATTFVPTGWYLKDANANGSWIRTTAAGGFGTSTASALFDNYQIDEAGSRDELQSPKYDFNGYSSATMTFDVAYARYNATYSDSLAVLVSTNCGATFTQVYLKGGTTLSTRADLTTAFTPAAAEWRTETVSMTPYVGQSNVMVVFQNRGRYGNNIYLDNINITGVASASTPTADFSGTPTTICAGQTVTFTNLSTGSPTSYAWTFTGGTPATSTATNPTITYSTAGTYAVSLTATNGSGSNTMTKPNYIVVNALPTATAGSNSPLCAGATLNLTTPTVAGATYSWSGPSGYTSTSQNPSRTGVTTAMAGTYTVTVTANGCSSTSSVTVVINANPTATASSNSPICVGATLNLATPTVSGATYAWTGPSSYTSTSQNPSISGVTAVNAGSYSVTVTANGCSSTSSTTVVVTPAPTATAGSNSPICTGATLNLTTPTVAGATYAWSGPSGYTSTSQNPTRPSATAAMAGTYTVTVTAGGCSSTSSVTVVINTAPSTTASSNSPVCAGATINLATTSVSGATYSWTGPNSFTSTAQNPSITNATVAMAGTYIVTVNNGCTATSSTTVVVNAAPAAAATSNSPVCEGATITLSTTSVAGATYGWTGPGGFTSAIRNPSITSSTTAMSGTYIVTVTNAGCSSTSSVTVTVNALPTATAASNSPLCAGATLNLTTPTVSGATYAWSGPSGYTSTAQNPSRTGVTTAMAGTYTVTVTANGCSSTSSVTVVINANPTATASSNSPVCAGATLNLATPTVAGATYAWTGPSSYTSTSQNPSITNALATNAGSYSVTVTANGCSSTSSTTVVVNAAPIATAGSNSPICSGATLNLTTPTVAGATYAWTGPSGYTSTSQNPTRPSATVAMSGTYTVTVTAGGCSSTSSVTVVINTAPSTTASSNSPVCVGAPINLATTAVSGATYSWTGPLGYTSSLQNPSITTATAGMAGTYTVTVNNGCTTTSSTIVVVNAAPAAAATSNSPVCAGATINLNTTTVAGASYAWTGPGGFTSAIRNPSLTGSTTAMSGTYTVTVTNGGCSSTSSVTVTVNALPIATAGSNSPLCAGATLNLTTPTVAGATYAWAGPGGYTSTAQNPSRTNVTTAMAGTYTVTVTANGCTSTSSVTVVINANPTTSAGSNSPICAGSTLNLTTTTVAGAAYAWTGPGGFTSTLQNPTLASATTAMSGSYTVTVTNGGCSSTSSVTATVNALPTASAGSNSPLCVGATLNLTTPTVAGATYAWSGPGGYTSTAQNPSRTSVTLAMAGTYTVTVTANGCSSSSTTTVVINNAPAASAGSNSPICSGNTINLTTTTVAGATYAWTGPGGFTSTLQNPTRPGSTTAMSGSYTVTVTNGCSATSSTTVTVNATPTATATSNSPICAGATLTLSTPTVAGATYGWTGPGGYTSAIRNPSRTSATVAMSGTYTVTVTANGCTATSSIAVTINTAPTTTASSNSPVCTGNPINLTTTTVAGATYSWTGPNSFTSTSQSPVIGSAVAASAGSYTVTVNNGCTATSSTTVVVNSSPNVTANATATAVCAGDAVTFTGGGATSYVWNNGVTDGVPYNPTGTFTYTVTGTAINGCTDNDVITITFNALPNVIANATSTSICEGTNVTLTGSGATSFTWDNSVTNGLAFAPTSTLTYTVIGTDGNNCQNSDQITVTVNTLPIVVANASANPICQGDILTLGGSGAESYVWDNSVTDAVGFNPTGTLTYNVIGTDINGCTNTDQITVTVNPTPVVSYVELNDTTCKKQTIVLTPGTPSGGVYSGPGVSGNTFSAPAAGGGNHTVTYSVTNGFGCTGSASSIITVGFCKTDLEPGPFSVGVDELDQENSIHIYPNPSNGQFTITWPNSNGEDIIVSIYNGIGQVIYNSQMNSSTVFVDLKGASRGVYYITITSSDKIYTNKFVID